MIATAGGGGGGGVYRLKMLSFFSNLCADYRAAIRI